MRALVWAYWMRIGQLHYILSITSVMVMHPHVCNPETSHSLTLCRIQSVSSLESTPTYPSPSCSRINLNPKPRVAGAARGIKRFGVHHLLPPHSQVLLEDSSTEASPEVPSADIRICSLSCIPSYHTLHAPRSPPLPSPCFSPNMLSPPHSHIRLPNPNSPSPPLQLFRPPRRREPAGSGGQQVRGHGCRGKR